MTEDMQTGEYILVDIAGVVAKVQMDYNQSMLRNGFRPADEARRHFRERFSPEALAGCKLYVRVKGDLG